MGEVEVFIQYKGTDICFDFTCACGMEGHVDGFFAQYVKCPTCGSVYRMPCVLNPEKVQDVPEDGTVPVVPVIE